MARAKTGGQLEIREQLQIQEQSEYSEKIPVTLLIDISASFSSSSGGHFMDQPLAELLSGIPDDIFFDSKGDPKFNSIFVEVARIVYRKNGADFSIPTRDLLTDKLPNLSTFQRAVTKERRRRAS